MKLSTAQAGQVTGSFPYPRPWLDTESEEIAHSIGKWSDTELIGKRLVYRENLEHQMQALTILSKDLGVDRFIWPEHVLTPPPPSCGPTRRSGGATQGSASFPP